MPLTARRPSQALVDIVATLDGTWRGYVAMCRCPAHDDSEPSLSLRQGDKNILVTCFAGCSPQDVLRELSRVRPGHSHIPPDPPRPSRAANVERIWNQAGDVRGTLAEHYLASRHLLPLPLDIRFHPRCPYLPRPQTVFEPALLVAVRENGRLVALQRIFLLQDGSHYTRKAMLGEPASGAWQGGAGGSILAIAEGFETAAAFTRLRNIPCWAALGARRLDLLTLPRNITTLFIAEDNDFEGRRAAEKASARYIRPGLAIHRAPPPTAFNDWANALDAQAEGAIR